jgi:hypothetical protein
MKKQRKRVNRNAEIETENSSKNGNEDFPGYPIYPPGEDLMNTSEKKFEIDIENSEQPIIPEENPELNPEAEFPDPDLRTGTAADVTQVDLEILGDKNLEMDMGDDEDLRHRMFPVDMEGKDLVVPGSEDDDENEKNGSEDEENNFYSQADT